MNHTKFGSFIAVLGIIIGVIVAIVGWQRDDLPDPQLAKQIKVLEDQIESQKNLAEIQRGNLLLQQHQNFAILSNQFDSINRISDRAESLDRLNQFAAATSPQRDTDHHPTQNLFASLDQSIVVLKKDIADIQNAADEAERIKKEKAIKAAEVARKAAEAANRAARIATANRLIQTDQLCRNIGCSGYILK